jgi:hypothetical protein
MNLRKARTALVMCCVLGVSSCSKAPTTAPKVVAPAAVMSSEFEYSLGSFYADSGYTVKSLEYADAHGVVTRVAYQAPLWTQKVTLKPGDRMYVRAEVTFPSILSGGIQVVGPAPFYASAMAERLDGPATSVLVIDQIVK